MGKFIDLTGQKFGRLTVLVRAENNENNGVMWLCKCECGRTSTHQGKNLRNKATTSCGCFQQEQIFNKDTRKGDRLIDITGQKFGQWTVVSRNKEKSIRKGYWNCICECGKESVIWGRLLRNGSRLGCGCSRRKLKKTGIGHLPEYSTWTEMKRRCYNSDNKDYKHYGGRGIKICARWFNSSRDFISDMGSKPSAKHSLDRIDNNANYSCGRCDDCKANGWTANCRWATMKEQSNNRRTNK